MIDKTRKKEAIIFYLTGKTALFSKICVFNNLLCLKELILLLPQKLSKHLPDPYKLIFDNCHVREYEKNVQNFFCTGMFAFFSSTSWVLNLDLIISTVSCVTLDNTRKNRPKSYVTAKIAYF